MVYRVMYSPCRLMSLIEVLGLLDNPVIAFVVSVVVDSGVIALSAIVASLVVALVPRIP